MGCNSSVEQHRISGFYGNGNVNYMGDLRQVEEGTTRTAPTVNETECDVNTLKKYLKLERQIVAAEEGNPLQMLEIKTKRLEQLQNELDRTQRELGELEFFITFKLGVNKDGEGETSVRTAISKFSQPDSIPTEEQEEFFVLLNQEEMARKTVLAFQEEKALLEKDIGELRFKVESLNSIYREQDELLDRIFGKEYGSVQENVLEAQLDILEERRAAIVQADALWRQARLMVDTACNQLGSALESWTSLPYADSENAETRFSIAAMVRDNLVAAGQNLLGAHQNLYDVQFPYCKLDEIQTLGKATAYVFTDMQSAERHQHAAQCYQATFLRAKALNQWLEQVINMTIQRDLETISAEVRKNSVELRNERVKLIRGKIMEVYGNDFDVETIIEDELREHENARPSSTETTTQKPDEVVEPNDLAPPPTSAEIFGRINQLAAEHQQEMERYLEEMQSTQGRLNSHLQEVLKERRQRRARQKVDEAEKAALIS